MTYRVRRRTSRELVFGGQPQRLKWAAVRIGPSGQETVVRAFATRGEADGAVRYWKLLAAQQAAKGGEYPPSL